MKKLFLRLSIFLCFIVLLTGSLAVTLFLKPSLVLNESSLGLVNKHFLNNALSWQKFEISVSDDDLWRRIVTVEASALRYEKSGLRFSIPQLSAAVGISLTPSDLGLYQIGPIQSEIEELRIPRSEEPKAEEQPTDFSQYIEAAKKILVKEINIDLKKLVLEQEAADFSVSAQLNLSGLNENDEDSLAVTVREIDKKSPFYADLSAKISSYTNIFDPKAKIALNAELKQNTQRLDLNLDVDSKNMRTQKVTLQVDAQDAENKGRVTLDGERDSSRFDAKIRTDLYRAAGKKLDVRLTPCTLMVDWEDTDKKVIDLDLKCEGQSGGISPDGNELVKLFATERVFFEFDIYAALNAWDSRKIETRSSLSLRDIDFGMAKLVGGAKLSGTINLDDPLQSPVTADLDFKLKVSAFQKLVKRLSNSSFAIPAPANQLRGAVSCAIAGRFRQQDLRSRFPLGCKIDLKSKEQKLKINSDGFLSLKKQKEKYIPHLNTEVLIAGIELVLPPVSANGDVPQLAPDKRFVLEQSFDEYSSKAAQKKREAEALAEEQAKKDPAFTYNIRVRSDGDNAILIYTNLLDQPVPIGVDVTVNSSAPPSGKVFVRNYKLELLRREADVELLSLALAEKPEDQLIDGKIRFQNNDYKITMTIYGTASNPQYLLESTPPLSNKELLAVLLFGKQPDLLDSDELNSVGETEAAIADGAIGLVSMYYLASTPIERVGYSPESGVFSAKINLQEGFSLSLGSDGGDTNQVGLRKRLGNGWIVDTTVVNDGQSEVARTIAMLKWGRRY